MNEITTLFTDIGTFFSQSDWFQMVKWPFWILLSTVAAGGIYCARFGKKTLFNQAISGVLSLIIIYLGGSLLCIHFTFLRRLLSELPFVSATPQAVALTNPINMELGILSGELLRLMILVALVLGTSVLLSGYKTVITWFFSQIVSIIMALILYAVVIAGIMSIFPDLLLRYAVFPVVFVCVVGLLMFCAKFIFTVVVTGGNPYFSSIYKFFTVNRGGSLLTSAALCFMLTMVLLVILQALGLNSVVYHAVNTKGLSIILTLVATVLCLFNMLFCDRKKS